MIKESSATAPRRPAARHGVGEGPAGAEAAGPVEDLVVEVGPIEGRNDSD